VRARHKARHAQAAWALAAAAAVCVCAVSSGLWAGVMPRGAVVLDQQEIGTYEAAYDPHEEVAVDNEYEAAMPFRDPGHISRAEIRLAHALARSGSTKRDESWDFVKPLWGKYIQAMRDPTDVEIGWTNPRKLSEGADFLQTAVERHAYGSEGHREPERGFDVGEPAAGAGFEWPRDLRNGLGMDKPTQGFQSAMPHMMRQSASGRRVDARGSKLETQVQDLHKMLQSEADTMRGLTDEVRELRAEKRAAKDDSFRQQLTYKVMKDKLVHSRLKAQVAQAKAKEAETEEVRKLLAAQTHQMHAMQEKLTSLAAARKSAAKNHRARMSAKAAQQDLTSYFSKLDRQEAREEISEAKAKLSKLTGLLGTQPAPAAPRSKATGKGNQRGSLLEAVSAPVETKAHKQELATMSAAPVQRPASHTSLHSLVDELKEATSNEAPYLPM